MFSAITYPVAAGHEDEVADIFSMRNFIRADSPVIRDEADRKIGRIIGTGLFIRQTQMVRLIQYEGELNDVARHMAGQQGVQQAERKLAPLLTVHRDTRTVEGFLDYFTRSSMTTVVHEVRGDQPVDGLIALCDRLDPAADTARLDTCLADSWRLDTPGVLASLAFRLGTNLIRFVQYEGDRDEVLGAWSADGGAERERRLEEFRAIPLGAASGTLTDALAVLEMRNISLLSVASLLKRA